MQSLNPTALFFHCSDCVNERPDGISPAEYSSILVGITPEGDLVVWCARHDKAIGIFQNGSIDTTMGSIINNSCDGCGEHDHTNKETKH